MRRHDDTTRSCAYAPARRDGPSYLWGVIAGMSVFVAALMFWPSPAESAVPVAAIAAG